MNVASGSGTDPRHCRCRSNQRPARSSGRWTGSGGSYDGGVAPCRVRRGWRAPVKLRLTRRGRAIGMAPAQSGGWEGRRSARYRARASHADRNAQWGQSDSAAARGGQSHRSRRRPDLRGDRGRSPAHRGPACGVEEAREWRQTQRAARCKPPRSQGLCPKLRARRADRCLSALRECRAGRLRPDARGGTSRKRHNLGRDEPSRRGQPGRVAPQASRCR